ncbi:hypothetical protein BaRGS_00002246 [Batillaria attramentaria]|uniref:Transmembrane protein n=1 Tax=Batillaria attramentaria TaxID=370345 RepID=A0ABD0M4V1_9CAEN
MSGVVRGQVNRQVKRFKFTLFIASFDFFEPRQCRGTCRAQGIQFALSDRDCSDSGCLDLDDNTQVLELWPGPEHDNAILKIAELKQTALGKYVQYSASLLISRQTITESLSSPTGSQARLKNLNSVTKSYSPGRLTGKRFKMTATSVTKRLIQILYHLTVGLVVELIKAGLFHICVVSTMAVLSAAVLMVTWRAYVNTSSFAWTAAAAVCSLLACCVIVVVLHRLARDVLGLTKLSLGEVLALMFGGRRRSEGSRGDKQQTLSKEADDETIVLRRRVIQRTTVTVQALSPPPPPHFTFLCFIIGRVKPFGSSSLHQVRFLRCIISAVSTVRNVSLVFAAKSSCNVIDGSTQDGLLSTIRNSFTLQAIGT